MTILQLGIAAHKEIGGAGRAGLPFLVAVPELIDFVQLAQIESSRSGRSRRKSTLMRRIIQVSYGFFGFRELRQANCLQVAFGSCDGKFTIKADSSAD